MAMMQKIIFVGISSMLLVAVILGVVAGVMRSTTNQIEVPSKHKIRINAVSKSVGSLCQVTDYKEECVETLSSASTDQKTADPKECIVATIKKTFTAFTDALKHSKNLGQATTLDNMNKEALSDCNELLEYGIGELQDAIESSEKGSADNINMRAQDLKNWLSAAISYEEICIDGLTNPELRSNMTKSLEKSQEFTKNALAIITEITKLVDTMKGAMNMTKDLFAGDHKKEGRRLLNSGRYPEWLSAADRKLLRATESGKVKPNVVVAKDGSGNYKTIQQAVDSVPEKREERFIIYVKAGVYYENVIISKKKLNVFMYGDGARKTAVSGNKNYVDGTPTFRTATFAAIGNGFICKSMGFRNTAGAKKHQAVALRVQSDMSAFFNCRMDAHQDTLYVQTHRQFYRNCVISGTVDFIFGMSAVVIQNCLIIVRKPMDNQKNMVTASGRSYKYEDTGIVIHNCRVVPDRFLAPVRNKIKSYLGRPWKQYARTVFMESRIGDLIQPEGWLEWDGDFALKTLYYAEYKNTGIGANTSKRVKWSGYHVIKNRAEALKFTVGSFIQGNSWIKYSGIPFIIGLRR